MCNLYNTGFGSCRSGCGRNTCGYNSCGCNICGYGNNAWGCSRQLICRDCCGNIHVNQSRQNSCSCCNPCVCENNGDVAQNGNGQTGRFTCVTFCGVGNGSAASTTNTGDLYYARQYGLYPFGYNRGCGCTLDAVSDT